MKEFGARLLLGVALATGAGTPVQAQNGGASLSVEDVLNAPAYEELRKKACELENVRMRRNNTQIDFDAMLLAKGREDPETQRLQDDLREVEGLAIAQAIELRQFIERRYPEVSRRLSAQVQGALKDRGACPSL